MVNVVDRLMCFFDEHGERKTDIGSVINNNNAGILNTALFVMSCNGQEEWKPFDRFIMIIDMLYAPSGSRLF